MSSLVASHELESIGQEVGVDQALEPHQSALAKLVGVLCREIPPGTAEREKMENEIRGVFQDYAIEDLTREDSSRRTMRMG